MAISLTQPTIGSTDWGTDINDNWQELLDAFNSGIKTIGPINMENGAGKYFRLPSLTTTERNNLTAVNGMLIYNSTANEVQRYENSSWGSFGGGSVTAVTASSPLASSGGTTPNISFSNQSANLVLAGPSSGAAAAPTFRALVTNDLASSMVTYAKIQDVSATDKLLGRSSAGAGVIEEIACTSAGRALLDDADATAQRATLGLVIGTNVQAYNAALASIAGLTTSADKMIYTTASNTYAVTALTAFARGLLDDTDAAEARSTLGLVIGTDVQAYDAALASIAGLTTSADKMIYTTASDTYAVTALTSFARGLLDDTDATAARATLGVIIGTDVQAYDAALASIAGLTTSADKMIYTTASDTYAVTALTSFARGLLDDTDATAARATLGVIIGTDVQAYDAALASIAGLNTSADKMIYTTASDTYAVTALTSFARGLLDDTDAAEGRATLGVVIGTNVQPYDAELTAIAGLSSGIVAITGAGTAAARSITGAAADGITVTNGNGVSGNPAIALNINGMTAETSASNSDEIAIYDASATALRKMTRANFLTGISAGGSNTSVQYNDNGSLNGSANHSWDNPNLRLTVTGGFVGALSASATTESTAVASLNSITALATGEAIGLNLRHTTSMNMSTSFGTKIVFSAVDDTAGPLTLAEIGSGWQSADSDSNLELRIRSGSATTTLVTLSGQNKLVDFVAASGRLRIPRKSTTGDPGSGTTGEIYYNENDNVFRGYQNGSWYNLIASPNGSSGYIQFNTSGAFNSDSNLYWDNSNKRFGLGTTSPGALLDVKGTMRFSGSTSGYVGLTPAAAAGSTLYTLPSAAPASNGQVLSSTTGGVMSWANPGAVVAGSSGEIQFNTSGNLDSDSNLFWDDTNKRLGISTTSPGSSLDVKGTLRLSGSTSGYVGLSPAAAAGSATYVLPSAAPTSSGKVLSSTTGGTMSWVAPSIVIRPFSEIPVDAGKVFANVHVGTGSYSKQEEGLGVMASLSTNATWRLRFQMPAVLPGGTATLRLVALCADNASNPTSHYAQVRPAWKCFSSGSDPSASVLDQEALQSIEWDGKGGKYVVRDVTLGASTVVAGSVLAMDLVFQSSSWSLNQVSTWQASIVWVE